MSYLPRTVDLELDELLAHAPALAIDGPKGVGKTDTARRRAQGAWFLDDPAQRGVAEANFAMAGLPEGTFLVDEWQRLPQVWDAVRRQVDAGAPAGRFLMTGSATPKDSAGTHSGAGRILSLRMRPMGLHERGLVSPTVSVAALLAGTAGAIEGKADFTVRDYADAITSSGLPGVMRSSPRLRRGLLDAYLQRVIDRDLPDLGFGVRRPQTLRRWLAAYAAASSTTMATLTTMSTMTMASSSSRGVKLGYFSSSLPRNSLQTFVGSVEELQILVCFSETCQHLDIG